MLDLVIRGGDVVTAHGVGPWGVAIKGEKIVAVALPGAITQEAARVIDASGKVVVPGGIEPHVHIDDPIITQPDLDLWTVGTEEDTKGMAFGGVTTHLDFCFVFPGTTVAEAIETRNRRWAGKSYVDYSFHVALGGPLPLDTFDQIPEAVQSGYPSFKVFTAELLPPHPKRAVWHLDFGRIGLAMEKIAASGGIMTVHGEDNDLVQFNYERFKAEGRTEGWNLHLVHSNLSEHLSFRRTTALAKANDAALYFVHVTAREGVAAIEEARAEGQAVYGEVLTHFACHSAEDYKEPRGYCYHTYPSLKFPEDQEAQWSGLLSGTLSTTATDEHPTTLDVKLMGQTIEDVTGGAVGAEARMGICYSEGVVKRGMSLERYVDVTSTNAARILGFYPRKGAIAPGSDADIVFIDPSIHKTLTRDDFHVADYSPWEGWEVHGWPVTTIMRGNVIVEEGRLHGRPGDGQAIPRKIAPEVSQRPVC